jgi:acylphosphatase
MLENLSLQAIVHGRVQGVYFRAFVQQKALELGLTGYTRNLPSGNEVEVLAEGDKEALDKLLIYLKIGSSNSKVEGIIINWKKYTAGFEYFEIRV